jgi:CRP-like cAMP-binding protein
MRRRAAVGGAPDPYADSAPRRSSVGLAFRNRAMARLLCAFALVTAAEWACVTSLSIYVFGIGGTLAVGLVGFRFVPGAISGALFAPLVERRRGVLAGIAVTRTVLLACAAAWVLAGRSLAVVIGIIAIDAVVSSPYRGAQSRILPVLAREPAELAGGAAGVSMMKTLGQAGGGLAGGVLAAVISPGGVIAGAAAAMAGAATLSWGLQRAQQVAHHAWTAELRDGLAAIPEVLRHREASPLVLASVMRTLVRGLWTALAVVVALRLFQLGSSGLGLLQAAAGVGAVIGLAVTAALIGRSRLGGPCALAFLGVGVTISVIGIFPLGVGVAAVIVGWGASMAVADATSLSLLHRLLHSDTLSRVIGVMEALKLASEGIGALLAPLIVTVFGLRPALILAGLPLPVIVLLGWPQIRRSDLAAAGRSELVSLLHHVRILQSLDMASLEDLAARVKRVSSPAGGDVIRQGDVGDLFYVIASGEAEVVIGGYPVGRLHRGAGFGERALLRDSPRTATVSGVTALELYALDRTDFLMALTGQRPDDPVDPERKPRLTEVAARPLSEVLGDLTLLSGVPRKRLAILADGAAIEEWEPQSVVIREGDEADAVYVVLAGRAQVTIGGQPTAELHPGDSFGEIAVLHHTLRTGSVIAIEPLKTCRIAADAFLSAIPEHQGPAIGA